MEQTILSMVTGFLLGLGIAPQAWAQAPRPNVFVDAIAGSDLTGTYDAALGEVFPIIVGPGITIAGASRSQVLVAGLPGAITMQFNGAFFAPPDGIRDMTIMGGGLFGECTLLCKW